jgi:hypothetical protein
MEILHRAPQHTRSWQKQRAFLTLPLTRPTGTPVRATCIALLFLACTRRETNEFHGVRLGMTAQDVRARFDETGSFGSDGEALTLATPGPDVASARFEFHRGVLVAVRASTVRPPMGLEAGARYSPGAVADVTKADNGFAFRWIARDCPAHAAEAETLVKNGKPW